MPCGKWKNDKKYPFWDYFDSDYINGKQWKKIVWSFFLKTFRCNIQSKKFWRKKMFFRTLKKFGRTEISVLRNTSKFLKCPKKHFFCSKFFWLNVTSKSFQKKVQTIFFIISHWYNMYQSSLIMRITLCRFFILPIAYCFFLFYLLNFAF